MWIMRGSRGQYENAPIKGYIAKGSDGDFFSQLLP